MTEFKNRKGQNPNRRKLTILEQRGNEIIADIELADNPKPGDEGTPLNAELFSNFERKVDDFTSRAHTALEQSIEAINKINKLESDVADRGATIYVGENTVSSVSFEFDPQLQISSKLTTNFAELGENISLNSNDLIVIQNENGNNKKIKWENIQNQILDKVYPIGAVYISVNTIEPGQLFGGSWIELENENALWITSTNANNAGQTLSAGLPNLEGAFRYGKKGLSYFNVEDPSGVFGSAGSGKNHVALNNDYIETPVAVTFNASKYNSIYGNSNTVQPPAVMVYAWRRIG